ARPGRPAVGGAVGRLVEAGSVEHLRIARIDGDVVDVLRLRQHVRPGGTGVGGEEDPAAGVSPRRGHAPGGEIETTRVAGVRGDRVGSVGPRGQGDARPVLGPVRRAIEGTVAVVTDTAAL